jgi:hypothetical protein
MSGHGSKLRRKQEEAIAALLSHKNLDEAARSLGISGKTLLRWTKDRDFAAAYRAARRDAFSQCIARLQQAAGAATTTVLKLMVDQNVAPACRLRAAEAVLTQAMWAREIEDFEARVAELERMAQAAREKKDAD